MNTLQAIVFDMDGTLADTEDIHRQAFNLAFTEFKCDWQWSREQYHDLLAVSGGRERIRQYLAERRHADAARLAEVAAAMHARKSAIYRELLSGTGTGSMLKIFAVAAVGADAVNNLPAVLMALPALGPDPGERLWPLLLGVNLGPVLVVTGSLAGLLWLDTAQRLGVEVDARTYTRIGLRIGLPVLLAAAATMAVTNRLL